MGPNNTASRSTNFGKEKTDGAITDKKNTSNNDLIRGNSSNLFKSSFDVPT